MTTSVPLSDEVLVALVHRCLLAEDPVPGAVLDQALAALEGVRAATRHARSSTEAYPVVPVSGPRVRTRVSSDPPSSHRS